MRYLALTKETRKKMLSDIGCSNVDELFNNISTDFLNPDVKLPSHKSEVEVNRDISSLANKNKTATHNHSFLGAGCYNHYIPASVDYIIQRSEFMTAYTPYQPEISQGTLTAIFEYQTFITRLTGQEISNASMYDGATATAEAVLMASRINKKRKNVHILEDLHPQYLDTVKTYLSCHYDINIKDSLDLDDESACLVVQNPSFFGEVIDIEPLAKKCEEKGVLLIVVINEIVSLGLLPPPKQADIVVGEASSIGVPMSFGGPHLGFMACKKKYIRQMPGRVCGVTEDVDGKKSYILTLNAREQHIRREKATSNICTNQGLCALAFTVHMGILGKNGFVKMAQRSHIKSVELKEALVSIEGVEVLSKSFFNEVTCDLSTDANLVSNKLNDKGIIGGLPYGNKMIFATTELTTDKDIEVLTKGLKEVLHG